MSYPKPAPSDPADASSFRHRRMRVTVTLSAGTFAGGGNTYTIDSLAMKASVEKLAWPDGGKCSVEIVGLPLDVMEQLSTLAFKPHYRAENRIQIFAGDGEPDALPQIFSGTITTAGADFNSAPDVKFKIEGQIGAFGRIQAKGQTAIRGSQDAASFIQGQVEEAGFTFRNEGVTAGLSNSVFSGSALMQAQTAADQIGAELIYDDNEAVLMPTGAVISGESVTLSAQTGLLGYPVLNQQGIEIKTIFNPAARFGGAVVLESSVPKASGTWKITKLTHKISANQPSDGEWETAITGTDPSAPEDSGKYI